MKNKKTGWERENRTVFDEIVTNYDKARWDYPADLYTDIIKFCGAGTKKAIEIGAGTGKATSPFLDAGYNVTAVEMSANMSGFLSEKFKDKAAFKVINSTFEDAVLEENSYDMIYAASAFHWVGAEIGCPKVLRLLKNNGVFALFRNNAVPQDGNKLYDDIQAVYDKHYYSYYKPDKRPVRALDMTYEDFLSPSEIYRGFRFEGLEMYGFRDIDMKLYRTTKRYSADKYLALLDTYSDHRALPEDSRASLYAGIKETVIRHGGYLELCCIFQLYMGKKLLP